MVICPWNRAAWLTALLLLAEPLSTAQEPADPSAPRSLDDIEEEGKQALAAQNHLKLGLLIEEAASRAEPAAYRSIIKWGLRGDDPDLEAKVYSVLKAVKDPAGRAVIYEEAARNPDFKKRIVLLGVVNQLREDPAAFAVLARAVQDPSRPVALTAVRRLKESKDPSQAVPPLIEALQVYEKTSRGRVVYDIRNALKALTRAELEAAVDWRNYWEGRKAGVKARSSGATRAVPAKSQFFQLPIESDRIVFVIDLSGSMEKRDPPFEEKKVPAADSGGRTVVRKVPKTEPRKGQDALEEAEETKELPLERQRLYRVKQELVRSIQALPENVAFTVVSFNNQIAFLDNPPRLNLANGEQKKRAVEWVKAMEAQGETWTDTALEHALTKVKDVDTIYLLSDGMPYRDGASIPHEEVRKKVWLQNRFVKCRINTIGFLQAGDNLRRFLYELAREHDGTFTALK